ncbi:hypothetical protein MT414_14120 [Mammaliicoccus sciuri]|uniref:hypothetical protein n=1 Tax=Mammaliicoccus sciuri TaxID=1296 RepID=UPI001FB477AD|nr:hypothetical protein [Mammaliicoccus sciuri]MCJ1763151.1 hypothetical protein [Mammaliicoccus sciuri]WQJ50691.1 hypothetical protein P3U25_05495 [Mammaliicoccus sciuri]
MTEKSRLEHLVDNLNLNIKNNNPVEIGHYISLLEVEGFITEFEADSLAEDINNDGCTTSYSSFIKEDK